MAVAGYMIAISLSSGSELVFRGKIVRGILSLAFFCAIPTVVWIVQKAAISWALVGSLTLIRLGVITLVRVSVDSQSFLWNRQTRASALDLAIQGEQSWVYRVFFLRDEPDQPQG